MKLNKRYIRSIKENRSFYIASSVLTIVTLLMFYLFNIAGTGILDFSEDFFLTTSWRMQTFLLISLFLMRILHGWKRNMTYSWKHSIMSIL